MPATTAAPRTAPALPAQPAQPTREVVSGRRGGALAIGITEANPNLMADGFAPPAKDAALRRGRDQLVALRPDFVRLEVDWSKLQPAPGGRFTLATPADGCVRGVPPCVSFAGLTDELRAIAIRQRTSPGFEPLIVLDGVPGWAAASGGGCERPGTQPRSRPLRSFALGDYRRLIAAIAALGRHEGVELHWWSPWNEPNHPYFISPQRTRCDVHAPSLAPGVYAALARAMHDELRAIGGDRRLVLGELAGYVMPPGPRATGVSEFVGALPRDVVCAAGVWGLHDYGTRYGSPAAALAPVRQLEQALDRSGSCGRAAHVWITETGAGGPDPRRPPRDRAAACRRMAAALDAWNRDPRIDASFQYTFREDPAFPVGLVDDRLTTAFPDYHEWFAWGARRPSDPPPALAPQCVGG